MFEEVESIAGVSAMSDLGDEAIEAVETGRHPKTHRLRRRSRTIVTREYGYDIPPGSTLLKSTH